MQTLAKPDLRVQIVHRPREADHRPQEKPVLSVIGKGLYTLPQAAHLLCLESSSVNAAGVRRWAFGYRRRGNAYRPAIQADSSRRRTGPKTLTFLDLVELMHVAALLESGISWPKVREAVHVAARLLRGEPHPFARRKWFADAKAVYMELGERFGEPVLVEMAGDAQVVLRDCLAMYLRQIEFDQHTGLAQRWFPVGGIGGPVVLDPLRSFGLPIVSQGGVRTDVIVRHSRAGDSTTAIAGAYQISDAEVEAAITFEDRLSPVSA